MNGSHTRAAELAAACALAAAAVHARPGARDPTVPHRIAIGAPAGIWPMQRGDAARNGRSEIAFPTNPVVIKRIPLFVEPSTHPVVDARGRLVIATKDGKVIEVLPTGKVALTVTLDARAVLGPVIESDGTRLVVTRDAMAVGITPEGDIAFTVPLGIGHGPAAEPLSTRDSAAILALGSRITKLGSDGDERATAELEEPVVAVTEAYGALYLATETGRVFSWMPPDAPRPVGTFGGRPTSEVVALGKGRLAAVVRGALLVELGVRDGTPATLANVAPDTIVDTPALVPSGRLVLTTPGGLLLGFDHGRETLRHPMTPSGSLPVFAYAESFLPPVVDRTGAVAYVTPAGAFGIVLPSGETQTTTVSECGPPSALVPAGPRLLAVFCRSGFIALVGDAPARTR